MADLSFENSAIDVDLLVNVIQDSGVVSNSELEHKILKCFLDSGVEKVDDLQFLEESQLEPVLPPVKRKKLLHCIQKWLSRSDASFSACSVGSSFSLNTESYIICSTLEEAQEYPGIGETSSEHTSTVSSDRYQLPVEKLPLQLKMLLQNKKRFPTPQRLNFVRILADNILEMNCNPTRDFLRPVIKSIVLSYRDSLADKDLEGNVLGGFDGGYYSLLLSVEDRIQNIARASASSPKKRKIPDGCKKWNPTVTKSKEDHEQERKMLMQMFEDEEDDDQKIISAMKCCYANLRRIINSAATDITEIKSMWPLLFTVKGFSAHYNELVDGNKLDEFQNLYVKYAPQLLSYFMSIQGKMKQLRCIHKNILDSKEQVGDKQPEILGVLYMLAEYFGERMDEVLLKTSENCPYSAITPLPCIIAVGTSILTAKEYMVALDGEVIFSQIARAEEAVSLFFGTFFVFNCEYPGSLAITMEFLQRVCAQIDTKKLSRMKKKSKNKSRVDGVHAKVLRLLSALHEFGDV